MNQHFNYYQLVIVVTRWLIYAHRYQVISINQGRMHRVQTHQTLTPATRNYAAIMFDDAFNFSIRAVLHQKYT